MPRAKAPLECPFLVLRMEGHSEKTELAVGAKQSSDSQPRVLLPAGFLENSFFQSTSHVVTLGLHQDHSYTQFPPTVDSSCLHQCQPTSFVPGIGGEAKSGWAKGRRQKEELKKAAAQAREASCCSAQQLIRGS